VPAKLVCVYSHYTDPKVTTDHTIDTPQESDILIEKQYGQDVIDSLSVLEVVIPTFHENLWPKLCEIFPLIDLALQSRFAIVRQAAARCFATVCDLMTPEAMRHVIEKVVPRVQDPLVLTNRQGATELIYRELLCIIFLASYIFPIFLDVVNRLDIKALPYVIFLVVPILGRMSDSDDAIRSTSTNIFASLVKMIPLEVSSRPALFLVN
jgi:TATA-binding protein-associated factor